MELDLASPLLRRSMMSGGRNGAIPGAAAPALPGLVRERASAVADCLTVMTRQHPGANSVLLRGSRPVLVDTGFGGRVEELETWLVSQRVPGPRLTLVVNTHHHSDHVGGNCWLQSMHGVGIAAHAREAALVNARQAEACDALWLRQPVEPYRVTRPLREGDLIGTGRTSWVVVETPGHTLGHISLHAPEEGILIVGDAAHADDLGWLAPCRTGPDTIRLAVRSLERLAALRPRFAISGHGPAMTDPEAAFAAAAARLERWAKEPERAAWHAMKRIFASALMIEGGVRGDDLAQFLIDSPWFRDHARDPFGVEPAALVEPLLAEMLRSGAATWREAWLLPGAPWEPSSPGWPRRPARVADWPR